MCANDKATHAIGEASKKDEGEQQPDLGHGVGSCRFWQNARPTQSTLIESKLNELIESDVLECP